MAYIRYLMDWWIESCNRNGAKIVKILIVKRDQRMLVEIFNYRTTKDIFYVEL